MQGVVRGSTFPALRTLRAPQRGNGSCDAQRAYRRELIRVNALETGLGYPRSLGALVARIVMQLRLANPTGVIR